MSPTREIRRQPVATERRGAVWAALAAGLWLGGCGSTPPSASAGAGADLQGRIDTLVVIYAENRSFDNLYGLFPGANGIAQALQQPTSYLQLDRDGKTPLSQLPKVWNARAGQEAWGFVDGLPNRPFQINAAQPGGAPGPGAELASPDLVHRFYNHQMQINGGRNDGFAAWSDAGGLSMGYYDGSAMAMWQLARRYTLADNFFQAAFGGSFLNHFWLVCACTPPFDNAPPERVSALSDATRLQLKPGAPASALAGAPQFVADATATPRLDDGRWYAVNTAQPPYQPSGSAPPPGGDARLAASGSGVKPGDQPLPALDSARIKTVGDTLSAANVSWAWYAGAWNQALADRSVVYNGKAGSPNFQPHHQPFNYFNRFDPTTASGQAQRARHLRDHADLLRDIASGSLPQVAFYKPQGNLNQHPGYTDVMSGDAHVADLVARLQASKQWPKMAIVVTYDENGGFFDHVAPPKADRWGPGSRIPALVISPYARRGHVDHTLYDTTSVIKLITRRFGLQPLPGARATVGDLTNAFDFTQTPQ